MTRDESARARQNSITTDFALSALNFCLYRPAEGPRCDDGWMRIRRHQSSGTLAKRRPGISLTIRQALQLLLTSGAGWPRPTG